MKTASPVKNCQTDCSSQKQNTSGEKHELSSGHVLSQPVETRIIGSDAQNFQTIGSPILETNTSVEKYEMDSKNVRSEPMETGVVRSDAEEKCHLTGNSILKDITSGEKHELGSKHVLGESVETRIIRSDAQDSIGSSILEQDLSVGKHETGSKHVPSELMENWIIGSDAEERRHITENSILRENASRGKHELGSEHVLGELVETRIAGSNAQKNYQTMEVLCQKELCSERIQDEPLETRILGSDSVNGELLGTPMGETKNSDGPAHNESTLSSRRRKGKYMLSSTGSARVLRPRLHGTCKPPDPSGSSANVSAEREKKKKRKRTKKMLDDEFSRTRKRLRYLLTRMGYEHNFIDAYSGEGWKGQSVEKIKPEKELQRATSEILRCKLKIRELFQHLDSLCAEGRFQESLFDSEGQICSEDIFCAKCGSKDLSADNDIILCDGTCNRGFHQMCLEPPLLKEEIPPGDEGWLCPGCDCKVDCIDLLNDSQGTDLCINDGWEKVFPEAAAAAAGEMTDEFLGLPSEDSDDNEYNPDAPEVEEGIQTEGSSSEDSSSEGSDFTSASDDLGAASNDDQYLGLPSDDSEDDDYDPTAPDLEQIKKESSSSDFTSDSEDFSASSDANESSGTNEGHVSSSVDGAKSLCISDSRSKMGTSNKQSMNSELLSILEDSQGNPSPVSRKRQRERLDYQKLHDEAYGNVPSDSSDDEDWAEAGAPKDDGVGKGSSLSRKTNSQTITGRTDTKGRKKRDLKEAGNISRRRARQKIDFEGVNNLAAETHKDSLDPDLMGKRATASKTLGQAITQRLYESLRENEYPTRHTKENLAKELGITFNQVSKWFGNARWSLRHSSNNVVSRVKNVTPTKDQANCNPVEPESKVACNEVEDRELSKAGTPETLRNESDGKVDLGHQASNEASSNNRVLVIAIPANSPNAQKFRRSGRMMSQGGTQSQIQTRSRKSV